MSEYYGFTSREKNEMVFLVADLELLNVGLAPFYIIVVN